MWAAIVLGGLGLVAYLLWRGQGRTAASHGDHAAGQQAGSHAAHGGGASKGKRGGGCCG